MGMFATPLKCPYIFCMCFCAFCARLVTPHFKCFERTYFTTDMLRPILGLVVAIGDTS